jgi:hypothetical protein
MDRIAGLPKAALRAVSKQLMKYAFFVFFSKQRA